MSISIFTSAYNLDSGLFDWENVLWGFIYSFASEVVVATTTDCKDSTVEKLEQFSRAHNIKLVVTDIPFSDLAFDGKLKNAALQACTKDVCCLFDLDEKPNNKDSWMKAAEQLEKSSFDGLFIPVIDLYNSFEEYKSIGFKWYMTKNHRGIQRGVVNFARLPNGKIDHTKSDTTEAINSDGRLINAAYIIGPNQSEEQQLNILRTQDCPYVIHYGWLDKEKRKKQSEFWSPVWSNRAGFEVDSLQTDESLNKIIYKPHNLPV